MSKISKLINFNDKRIEKEYKEKGYLEIEPGLDKLFSMFNYQQYTVVHRDVNHKLIRVYHTKSNCPTMAIEKYSVEVLMGKINDGDYLQVFKGHLTVEEWKDK